MKIKGRMKLGIVGIALILVSLMGMTFFPETSSAAPPVVKTVPWVATNPLIPHDTYPGKAIRLKGTCDSQGANFTWTWDFGDGSPVATGTVTDRYAIEASHTYAGPVGTIWTARLTVQNTSTGETGSKEYYVKMEAKSLPVEVNVAIDEGLWELHKVQTRWDAGGVQYGNWQTWSGWYGEWAANINAFEVNGHLEGGNPNNPYVETVKRGMNRLFELLLATGIGPQTLGNPDSNGNSIGIYLNQGYYLYQGGMVIDAIIASGTPNAFASTGPANVVGRKYKDIVQDMVDWYAYCQYPDINYGGWRYNCQDFPDNSACQWGAIGLIPAERIWGLIIPPWVKAANLNWLAYSQHPTGYFGYTNYNPVWGPFADTASGLVQLVLDGKGRGYSGPTPNGWATGWDQAETFLRDQWDNPGGYTYGPMKTNYYYALFSFTKAMILHQPNPITMLHSTTPGVPDLDWYGAEISKGDPSDGVARSLVNAQNVDGWWWYHDPDGNQQTFETAWAIMMLGRTLFEAGAPVAVATAVPNPGIVGQMINFNGGTSFHQDASKSIVMWEWDLDNNGSFETPGVVASRTFPALGNYPVNLRVTDNSVPPKTATTTVTVQINTPPIAPTAEAGGPYNFCINRTPWFLDGTGSINPDEGQHQTGSYPGDTIIAYEWDLDGDGQFDDAAGPIPDVTAFFTAKGVGSYLIQLKVTDNTANSFPGSGMGNLSDTDSAQVVVRSGTDPACSCVENLTARPKLNKAELRWTWKPGAHHYNVYRGTTSGGPYIKIAEVSTGTGFYLDLGPLTINQWYYYVIREAALNNDELCQSNQASARPTGR